MMINSPCIALQTVPSVPDEVQTLARRLTSQELALMSNHWSPKRRAEFTAGRIAAHAAVARLLGCEERGASFSVLRAGDGPTGCPVVSFASGVQSLHVSISHADGLAIAAASFRKLGIDLATVQEQASSFADEAFSAFELERWSGWLESEPSSALTLTTAFAAKEAALKLLGTGFGQPLLGIEIIPMGCMHESLSNVEGSSIAFVAALVEHSRKSSSSLTGRFTRIDDKVALLLMNPTLSPKPVMWCAP
ncbi:MAG TPA: 4'-phosphopantetheinyl transferase superfamily protein [Polyangiaceae bacterium]